MTERKMGAEDKPEAGRPFIERPPGDRGVAYGGFIRAAAPAADVPQRVGPMSDKEKGAGPAKHQDTCAFWIRYDDNLCDCGFVLPAEERGGEPPAEPTRSDPLRELDMACHREDHAKLYAAEERAQLAGEAYTDLHEVEAKQDAEIAALRDRLEKLWDAAEAYFSSHDWPGPQREALRAALAPEDVSKAKDGE